MKSNIDSISQSTRRKLSNKDSTIVCRLNSPMIAEITVSKNVHKTARFLKSVSASASSLRIARNPECVEIIAHKLHHINTKGRADLMVPTVNHGRDG